MNENKPKIKICGITRAEDALLAQTLNAWAVGFIFFDKSKRFIKPTDVGLISKSLKIEKVGVFVNEIEKNIVTTASIANLSIIQLHGNETPEFCEEIHKKTYLPIIKALRIKEKKDIEKILDYKKCFLKGSISAILLDTFCENTYGGTGKSFDTDIAIEAKKYEIPIIMAGGINPENIKNIYKSINSFAIDVSSGVEISEGIKDKEKIRKLFEEVISKNQIL